ncbi:hypothetical protein [Microcoleus sp. D2_18a_D3]
MYQFQKSCSSTRSNAIAHSPLQCLIGDRTLRTQRELTVEGAD